MNTLFLTLSRCDRSQVSGHLLERQQKYGGPRVSVMRRELCKKVIRSSGFAVFIRPDTRVLTITVEGFTAQRPVDKILNNLGKSGITVTIAPNG